MAFKSPQIFQLYFSSWIFSKISFIFSYDSFMSAAWAMGTDGNIFPLCTRTVLRLIFKESLNKRHSDRVRVKEPL